MKTVNIDFAETGKRSPKAKNPNKRKKLKKVIIAIIILLMLCGTGYYILRILGIISDTGINLNPFDTIRNLIAKEKAELKKDDEGRTNTLFVGIDTRPSSPGLRNTDTVIVASYNHNTKEALLISIPRDMWVAHPYNETYHSKINAVYNSCENQEEESGLECLTDVASTVTNLDIHYSAMLDISGLIEVVDILGGVEVDVENAFTDYMFPNDEHGYTIVSFEAGSQIMDGEAAMQYARSRHAQGPEGSDFARARRQQKLIISIVEKIASIETYSNPSKIMDITEQVGENLKFSETTTEDIRAAIDIGKEMDTEDVYSVVLDPSIGNWSIVTEDPSTAYILYPELGIDVWDDIHKFINSSISYPGMYDEEAKIYVYNGGLGYEATYSEVEEMLEKYPFTDITFGGDMASQDYEGVLILSFIEETKYHTISELESYFETTYSSDQDQEISAIYSEDIMIILGIEQTAEPTSEE